MNDLKPFKHGEEGTHSVCNKHNIGGKSVCCECSGKTDCSDTPHPAPERIERPCCPKCIIDLDYKPAQCSDGECECHTTPPAPAPEWEEEFYFHSITTGLTEPQKYIFKEFISQTLSQRR